jgi:hypothetical protein
MSEIPRLLAIALCSAALAAASQGGAVRNAKLDSQQRAQCSARSGKVMIAGLSGNEICALPLADAGKSCTSGSQCIGDCLLDGNLPMGPGVRVAGRCEPTDYGFGCRTIVENSRVQHRICID